MLDLASTGAAFVRAVAVAAAAVCAGFGADALLRISRPRARCFVWALVVAPFLTPAILVGYGWQRTALSLREGTAVHEVLYAVLLLARLAPAAAVVLHFAPRAMASEALYCHRLALEGERGRVRRALLRLGMWVRGEGAAAGAAFAVVFLLAFAEFEMASLMNVRSAWTVSLLDEHVMGLAVSESLRLALAPLAIELAVLAGAALLLLRSARARAEAAPAPRRLSGVPRAAVWAWLAVAAAVVTVGPALVALGGALRDPGAAFRSLSYIEEIAASVLLGFVAGGGAYLAAGFAARRLVRAKAAPARRAAATALASGIALPGLLGPLVLALAVAAAFQLPVLLWLFDTPVPMVITVTLLVLPFAVVLRTLAAAERPGEALHLAGMLGDAGDAGRRSAGELRWALDRRRLAWVAFLLFVWGYFDMTASSILAPSGTTPVFVTLYNFMHYGRHAAVSAMVAGAFAAPLVVLVAGGGVARLASRVTAGR